MKLSKHSVFAIPVLFLPFLFTTLNSKAAMNSDNPFFAKSDLPFHTPNFSAILPEHYAPAFEAGMKQQLEEIQKIADNPEAPTFENTMVAMERSGDILRRVQAVFFNMTSANTDDKLQELEAEFAPKLSAHSDNISLNPKLFARLQKLWDSRESLKLSEAQHELLKDEYEGFIRAGAKLKAEDQTRIRELNEKISSVTTEFQSNLLAITKEASVFVDDVKELDGLSASEIAAAASAAKERGEPNKYLLAITNTTRQPVLVSLKNRALRQRVWEASAYRGLGRKGGIDNRPLVLSLAKMRAERAKLLGYANHAAYTLEDQMAETPEAAFKMLKDLVPQVRKKTADEANEIRKMMEKDGIANDLQPWDWEYYAEKVRQEKYKVDEAQVKPYFELDSILKNGVFFALNRLYGVRFEERTDLPVYHPTVRVFNVFDKDGSQLGLFYADYYHRDSKNGGAWMDSYVAQSYLLGEKPVVVNVMNIPKPAEGEPTLVSFDNAVTMFHELGHGVHGLFSAVEYPSQSGTSVPRDFVEFPSTFHEDCAIDPVILKNYAKHYKTGETIPLDLLNKSIAASKFNKGYDTMEYLSAALLDLAWHSLSPDQIPSDVEAFEAKTLKDYGVDFAPIPPRYKSQYFAHVWSGGYSAGYYAYLWSEVLAADAFAFMRTQGGLTAENGNAFRKAILSRGGTREAMKLYVDFRNQEPTVDGLLVRRGLK